ncbi:hypothetical protein TNCV_312511 [Trichonephila clavipes]|nr:hypothetical protein TNCV_312511 [Trichonephila clavipes]
MSRSGDQSEPRSPVFKSSSKIGTYLSTLCSRDQRCLSLFWSNPFFDKEWISISMGNFKLKEGSFDNVVEDKRGKCAKFINSNRLATNLAILIRLQGRSYRRFSHINDTGRLSYRGPNKCNYSATNRVLISKKEPLEEF